jgi:hypothetical protein
MGPKIFNIGLNRAGTTSLARALQRLGYRTLHYHLGRERLVDIADRNVRAGRRAFDGIDGEYDAFSDFAGQRFYRLLDHQYPGSRFILTIRALEAWLDSRERKVLHNLARPDYRFGFRTIDRPGWIREREAYLQEVDAWFAGRGADLLVLDIPGGDGWEKLCSFLGRPVPAGPFPFENRLAPPA